MCNKIKQDFNLAFTFKMIIIFLILLFSTEIFEKSNHCKIYKVDYKSFEPYINITYFKLKPINRYLSVINADGFLKQTYTNGIVIQFFKKKIFFLNNLFRSMDNFLN